MPLHHFTTTYLHPSPLRPLHFTPICRSSSSSSFRPNFRRNLRPSFRPTPIPKPSPPSTQTHLPARDRIIDFGRHKGKRLGSVPSSYLRWVSENLCWGDTAGWAKLADEVLADPIYNDRIEWEHAYRLLSGDDVFGNVYAGEPDEDVFDVADRFGWDFQNHDAWSKIDFDLLGTSFGGRIPRKNGSRNEDEKKLVESERDEEEERYSYILVDEKGNTMDQMEMVRGKRAQRIDRRRGKREQEMRMKRLEQIKLVKEEIGGVEEKKEEEVFKMNDAETGEMESGRRLFPGRGALLDKIKKRSGR